MQDIRKTNEWQLMINDMSSVASSLSRDYIYYMHMLAQCKVITTEQVQTMGVSFHRDHFRMYVNYDFFMKMKPEERLGVLKHEMLHILNGHLTFKKDESKDHTMMNIATDCAINQMIIRHHLPEGCILPNTLPVKEGVVVPENLTGEQYYGLLEKHGDEEKIGKLKA